MTGTGPDEAALVLFDGPCVLCQRSVRTIARFDTRRMFRFASLDSAAGRRALEAAGWPAGERSSVVLVEDGAAWTKSEAALRIARRLRLPLSALVVFRVVPRPLRDAAYDWIARHRYRWFGRTDACALLPADVRDRVIRD